MSKNNDGIILTSTLWNQSGTIYINIDGQQTALSGYQYNMYCPLQSASSTSRSVTGCSNTADAQILYYYLEQGYEFNLSVSASDYFILKNDSKRYNLTSGTSDLKVPGISQINNTLSGDLSTKLADGDFIAMLNLYCGVKNNSKYGSSTSTTWFVNSFYNGTNANVFKSAGFDSYYFIAYRSSDSAAQLFFKSFTSGSSTAYELTEVGFSVLRENLDYGEIIRVGIPNHAIYMDGYRYNSQTGQYEYHLNYGWGVNSSSTKWYTVSQLKNLNLKYVTIDLSPDIKVTVSNNSGEYCGGSFLRGVERINHIQNEKSTTFSFADDLAGETIILDSAVKFTSQTDLMFDNFCVDLISDADSAITSGRDMEFDLTGGSIAIGSNAVAVGISGALLDIELDNSWLYAGYYTGNFALVSDIVRSDEIYLLSDFDSDFLAGATGTVFKGGSGNDSLSLINNSAAFGDIDFGTGVNTLTVESGSMICGTVSSSVGTLTLDLLINSDQQCGAMITADTQSKETSLYSAVAGLINVKAAEYIYGTFMLIDGYSSSRMDDFQIQILDGDATYELCFSDNDPASSSLNINDVQYTLLQENNDLLLKISSNDQLPPEAPEVFADIAVPTNQNVTVTAEFSSDSAKRQFSYDNEIWQNYTGGITFSANGTVYFRGIDAAGNISEVTAYHVRNIDRIKPELVISGNPTDFTNQDVILNADASEEGTVEYFADGRWNAGSTLTVTQNGTYKFRATDAAGNVTETSVTVGKIDKLAPERPANITAAVTGYDADINWDECADNGPSGMNGYLFRYGTSENLTGQGIAVSESRILLEELSAGTWYFQIAGLDKVNNRSEWSDIRSFEIKDPVPENLIGSAEGLSWDGVPGAAGYIVKYSTDDFANVITLKSATTQIDSMLLPPGTYQWRVKAIGGEFVNGSEIVVSGGMTAQQIISDGDGNMDLFFAVGNKVWGRGYTAEHQTFGERVKLAGINRISHIFEGSSDASVMVMTDDANGDALFIDDIYTALPETAAGQRARFAQIDEIRAGSGDDIIDMTSKRFAYVGDEMSIFGGDGNDVIWASGSGNNLFGDAGNDRIIGSAGSDLIVGGSGNDTLHSGGGDDIFAFCENWGIDTVEITDDSDITLWFASGDAGNWDAVNRIYRDGSNSVTVIGGTDSTIDLKFGDEGGQYDDMLAIGAFESAVTERIFETSGGILA